MKKNLLFFSIFFLILLLAVPVFAQSQQTLLLKTGYNFKSFTVVPSITPQQLIVQYPSIDDIYLYHAYSGGFISVNEGTLTAFGPAKGYVFKCRQDLSLTVSGSLPGACGQITLMPEYNLVGFSKMPETITCSQLMARYSGIKGIYKWSADAGLFIQVVRDISGNVVLIDGVDPELAAGESYFFNMQGQCDLSYDLSQITLAGDGVTPSTVISNVSAVNGALTVNFTGAPLPLSLSNSDIAVNRSVNSAPFISVTPISLNRVADYTLEISLQPVSSLSDIDQTVIYRVSYMNSAMVNASVFTVLKGTGSKVAMPVFSVPGGSYNSMQILTLSCPTPDAEIYCSIDGSEPVPYYGYKYYPGVFGPFVLLNNKTIKAIAVKRGMDNSDVVTAVYTMDIPPAVEFVNVYRDSQTTCQLLDAANGLQPLCAESSNYESKLIFNLTEGDIVPLIVWKRNGKVVKLRLLQKMPKASEISAQGIVKINISINDGNLYTADALVALEKNLTSNSLQINSNYEVVNISSDFNYLSGTDVQLRDSIGNAVNTLNEIFYSNYISPEVKELIQPSFDFTASGLLNSFLIAVKHPQVKMFLDSNNLPRTVTVNSLVINDQTASIPGDLLTNFMMTTIAPVIEPGSQNGVPYPNPQYYFINSQLVTLSCATPGAVIYYTLDNTTPTTSSTLYTAPFTLTETKTVNVIAVKDGMKISPVSSRIFRRVGIIQSASAFRQSDGSLQLSIQTDYSSSGINYYVRFIDANSNEIFYSYINSFETSSGQPVSIYNSPSLALYEKILISYRFDFSPQANINLADFEILKSQVIESVLTPVISPANGYYLTSQTVTIVCATDGASIYYTTDGTEPSSTNGTLYTVGFEITTSLTVRAVAYKEGMAKSAVASMNYLSNNAVSAPIINPPGGTFSNSFIVTMMPSIPDCTIYYTVDGSMPTALSTVYTVPIIVTETTTITAIAVKAGMANSPIVFATFTKVN